VIRDIDVGDAAVELARSGEIRERHGVSLDLARRLWNHFEKTDLNDVDRERLQEVRGVGPVTAEKINPPRSEAVRALQRECDREVLFPVWRNGEDDKLRLWEENPADARSRITEAVRRARTVRAELSDPPDRRRSR